MLSLCRFWCGEAFEGCEMFLGRVYLETRMSLCEGEFELKVVVLVMASGESEMVRLLRKRKEVE